MLPNARPSSPTETCQSQRRHVIALLNPTVRSELGWVFVVLLRVVETLRLDAHDSALLDGNVFDMIIDEGHSRKVAVQRPVEPGHFFLYTIDVGEVFEVLVAVVIVLHILSNFFPDLSFYFWMLGNQVNSGYQIVGSCVDTRRIKSCKLVYNVLRVVCDLTFLFFF